MNLTMRLNQYILAFVLLAAFPVNSMGIRMSTMSNQPEGCFKLLQIEKILKKDSIRGSKLMIDFPETAFQEHGFFRIHNKDCVTLVYLYKLLNLINNNCLNEAQKMYLLLVKQRGLAQYQLDKNLLSTTDTNLTEEELLLKTLFKENYPKDSIINVLENQLAFYRADKGIHPQLLNSLFPEQQLFHHKLYWYWVILIVISLLLTGYIQKKDRFVSEESYLFHVKENQLKKYIDDLECQNRKNTKEIENLYQQMTNLQERNILRIGKGKIYYDSIMANGTMKNISVDDEQCFIDYYAYCFPKQFQDLTVAYSSLTLRHKTFLILSDMGFNDKDISRILFVKNSTIRNYKLRISKRKIKA